MIFRNPPGNFWIDLIRCELVQILVYPTLHPQNNNNCNYRNINCITTTRTTRARNAGLGRKIETKKREEKRRGEEKCKEEEVDDGETRRDVENAVHIKNAKISLKLTTNRVLVRACACSACVCVCVGARQPARWFFVCLHVCILGHATLPKNACERRMRERGGKEGPKK